MSAMETLGVVTPSIDAIVHATPEDVAQDVFTLETSVPHTPLEEQPLGKRKRLLHSLQRMSSSPSLARMRTRSSYKSGSKASVSCISLATPGSSFPAYGSSYGSEASPRFSTAPTSAYGSPRPSSPATPAGQYFRPRARTLGRDGATSVGVPLEVRPTTSMGNCMSMDGGDYFSRPVMRKPKIKRRLNFNFWKDMPSELRIQILSFLEPKDIVRCSSVSKSWHEMCFDGQLWQKMDTSDYYRDISGEALVNIIASAGPFVRDLNLRGCVQLREKWNSRCLADACRNLENLSIEGCLIDRTSIHYFMLQNPRLVFVNLSGLMTVGNNTMKLIGQHCPKVESLNVTWCANVTTSGLRHVVRGCPRLKELRAGEVKGWEDTQFMLKLFDNNTLERLTLTNCDTLTDDSLTTFLEGVDSETDYLTGRKMVPPRKLRHLDLTKCRGITDSSIKKLAHNCPGLEGLQLSKCNGVSDEALCEILPTVPKLTHLDLEELTHITNQSMLTLAGAPCASNLRHLGISYCESVGDQGMIPLLKACTSLTSLDMDNTQISDLSLTEAAAMVRTRWRQAGSGLSTHERPYVGLRLVAYDCSRVTWTGVREILFRNAEPMLPNGATGLQKTFPREIIGLKCFYNWQPTVEEHTKRVRRGDWVSARRLEMKWAEFMIATEEAGAGGAGTRRRRRRAREAMLLHADEEEAGLSGPGAARRRRARSGPTGCVVM